MASHKSYTAINSKLQSQGGTSPPNIYFTLSLKIIISTMIMRLYIFDQPKLNSLSNTSPQDEGITLITLKSNPIR